MMSLKRISTRSGIRLAGSFLAGCVLMQMSVTCLAEDSAGQPIPYSTGVQKPTFKVPALATDTHHHIYDSRFPVDPNSALRPGDATVSDYRLLQKRLGTSRHVIVQPSTYGVDNSGLVQSLKEFGIETTRGIAVVNASVTDAELDQLNAAGVRGIRFNLSQPGGATSMDMVLPLAERIKKMGWHIQVVATPDQIAENAEIWKQTPCPIVFDHLGHITDINHPAVDVIVKLMQQDKAWVKISGAYILSKVGPPSYSDRAPIAKRFIGAAPNRVVWGSDWPHPTAKANAIPDDAVLMNLLAEWTANDDLVKQILVDNPARLYGFK